MNFKSFQRAPVIIAAVVVLIICLVRWQQPGVLESLEAKTYDWRVRIATNFPTTTATNLGFVAISDESIARVKDGSLDYHYGLYWPRHLYGRLARELAAQGAKAVGFDILLSERRDDHSPVMVSRRDNPGLEEFLIRLHPGQRLTFADDEIFSVESDDFFAWQLHRANNVILAAEQDVLPDSLFRDYAADVGDISAERDADGVLRRACAFKTYRRWHWLFEKAAREYGLDLDHATATAGKITLPRKDGDKPVEIPLDADGNFNPVDFVGEAAAKIPRARPFTDVRVWHMGIVLAARELGLDLAQADVDLPHGRIALRNRQGLQRIIPVDDRRFFQIDWQIPVNNPNLTQQAIEQLLAQDNARSRGETNDIHDLWRDKLVVVGSTATGNDLTDLGATPLEKSAYLVSKHWNVANAVITNCFIRQTTPAQDWLIIAALGALTAWFTMRMRTLPALISVLALGVAYLCLTALVFVQTRWWLPIFLPVFVTLPVQYAGLVTWRVVFEQAEKRRVRSVFSKIVAPEVVQELLASDNVVLGGARREITVFFADIRGFTTFTDISREDALQVARQKNLTGKALEEHLDSEARETLNTVNTYLALVADIIKKHGGTLDKYIGDCVMAFWNAPAYAPQHALAAVRTAIEAQRAMAELNRRREQDNDRRAQENSQRAAIGQPPLPLFPILELGTGINTGLAIVGLMGSDAHILNYTVFGREVNLASRLEGLSGHGRIIIGEATYTALLRDDPELAATCQPLSPATVKGFRDAVKIYEVPWRQPEIPLSEPAKSR